MKNYADGRGMARQVTEISGAPCAFLPSSRRVRARSRAVGQREGEGSDVTRFLFVGRWHPNKGPDVLLDKARTLDLYYIPTRYPNGHEAGPPGEHYGQLQSNEAIRYAREIVEFCRLQMAGS